MKALSKVAPLFLCLLSGSTAFAQYDTAEVLGTIKDASGGAIAKAAVRLTNQGTAIEAKATTDENGNYDFFNVKEGRYTVTVEAAGFAKTSAADVDVAVGARQRVDLSLQVGNVSQSVEVSGAASLVETDKSEHGQVIQTQAIVELPLNGRHYSDLALLATNVHVSPIATAFTPNSLPREGAFNVNGMRSTYNNFLLDGVDNNSYGTSNQNYSSQVVQPSPDAVAEFSIVTSNFSAEYGRVGGGIVNAAMRSGTNQFHGTLYEFFRNTDLNATGYFRASTLPTLHRNQFGVTGGGPIIKNKLFFFVDYEGYRQKQGYFSAYSVPDLNDRAGILPANVTVINPLTMALYPAGAQIPVSTINPFAAAALAGLAAPNSGNPLTNRSNNLAEILPIKDYADKYDARLDYQIASNMSSFLRFSQRKDITYQGPNDPGSSGGDGAGFIHAIQQQAAIGYTWALSPSSLLDARFGFDHVLGGKEPPYLGGPNIAAQFGIQGLPGNLEGGFPTQYIGGFSSPSTIGRQTSNPQFQNPTSFNPKVNYSLVKGRHSIKAGYEFLAIRTEVLDINPLYGEDVYTGGFSKPTPAQCNCTPVSDSTSYNLADFYFGLPNQVQLGSNLTTNLRQHVNSLYVQDDWKVSSKLTVNIGLRWEFATPLWDRDNYWSNFNPATNTLVRASSGSLYNRALVNPDYSDWGPRIGIAYSWDSKTSIRAGYGISYDFFNRPGSAQEGINGPLAIVGVLNQSFPAGGPVPAGFLTTQNSFSTGLASTFNPVNTNNDYIPANTKWPYVQNWVLSLQREVAKNTVVEVAYTGNHSLRLPIIADYNQAAPNALTATCNATVTTGCLGEQARVPDPSFGAITWVDPAGNNDYHGLSVRFEHRFSQGLYFLNSFTWSHAIGDSEQALEYYSTNTGATPQNIYNLHAEYGPTSFDVKLLNVTSVVYNIPVGKGRQYWDNMNPVLDGVFGGWQLTGINTANTGTPINVYYTPSSINDVSGLSNEYRGEPILRPNVSGSAASQSTAQSLLTYFAGYSFTVPSPNNPFGNLGRNAFRAPSLDQWDLGIFKNFAIREQWKLQFRSEFFNILNKTNFGLPNQQSNSTAFGTIATAYPARQIQFGLKLMF